MRVSVGLFTTASSATRAALGDRLDAHQDPRGINVRDALLDDDGYEAFTAAEGGMWQGVPAAGMSFAYAASMLGGARKAGGVEVPTDGDGMWDTAEKLFGAKLGARNQRGALNQSLRAAFGRASEDELLGAPQPEAPTAADLGGLTPEASESLKREKGRPEVARDMAEALKKAVAFGRGEADGEGEEPSKTPEQ